MHDTSLLDLFTRDIGTAEQLLELIDSEFQVLGDRDLPRLQTILTEKLPLLGLLDQHGRERSQLLTSLGHIAETQGDSSSILLHVGYYYPDTFAVLRGPEERKRLLAKLLLKVETDK